MEAEDGDRSGADASVSEQQGGAATLAVEEMAVTGGEGCHGNGPRVWKKMEVGRYFCGDSFNLRNGEF